MLTKSTAVLAVTSVKDTADYYCGTLGFKVNWLWEEPPTFGSIGLGKAEIFLCQQTDLAGRIEGHQHYFDAEDIEALHAQHRAKGAEIISAIENKPWGSREYTVRDPNGYHLRFGGPEKYERPKTAIESLPAHIQFALAKPSLDEYVSLLESVNWGIDKPAMQAALDISCLCVLATDARSGQMVGMTRVSGAGKDFMIWDVVVRPSHQGQKIGTALVEKALGELRARGAPRGTFVGLFTPKHPFYERLGFKKSGGMSITL